MVRRLAGAPVAGAALWSAVSGDFKIGELEALPPACRLPGDDMARPIAGKAPRQWAHGGLPLPETANNARKMREAYASGQTTPSEVLDRLLARLDKKDLGLSTFSPFIALDREGAAAAAAASTERWKASKSLGPLDGIPIPIKDEFHMTGLPTRGGAAYLETPATKDAFVITKFREAGAVLPGKSHATEWGLNPLGYNEHFDMPRNPWSSAHGAGGSSTGTAVSVALGLAPVGLGSDGGGSIRIPSAFNGIYGIKPTYIRIGRTGDTWGPGTMPHAGPLGSSTEDLVDLLSVAVGVDPEDPTTLLAPDGHAVVESWRLALGRGVKGCRIGVLRSEFADATPEIAAACELALQALAREGAVLVDLDIPLAKHAPAVGALVIASESTANVSDDAVLYGHKFGDEFATVCALMARLPARSFLLAGRTRAAMRRQLAAAIAGVDVIALPTTARQAPKYGLDEGKKGIFDSAAIAGTTRFSFLCNLTGLPAGSVPVVFHGGLPIGLQIVGDAWDEASVLAVMAHCERLQLAPGKPTGWRSLLEV